MSASRAAAGEAPAPAADAPRAAAPWSERRRFLLDGAKMACGVGIFGLALGSHVRQAMALPPEALRPPGAGAEADFLGACLRCGLCVRACLPGALELAKPEAPVAAGTPYFTARTAPCAMCEDLPCIRACPTDALDHGLTDVREARMGLAVVTDRETCVNHLGLICDVCYRSCPAGGEAITLEYQQYRRTGRHTVYLPTVHAEHCTGCGNCESACVLGEPAIRVLPIRLAKGALGKDFHPVPASSGAAAGSPVGVMVVAPAGADD